LSTFLLFPCLSGSMWNNRHTSKKMLRRKKKGFFTEILKMSNSVSESEVMTFIKSHIGKMNSYHIFTHYLIISNLILSHNLYSSWIICSFMAWKPIFRNASFAHSMFDRVYVCMYKEFWLHFIHREIQNFCEFWPNMDFYFLCILVWRLGFFIVCKYNCSATFRWLIVQSSKPLQTLS
jgi:hypothetical protein